MISSGHGFLCNSWLCLLLIVENYCSNHRQGWLHGCKLAATAPVLTLPGSHHGGKSVCFSESWTKTPGMKFQQLWLATKAHCSQMEKAPSPPPMGLVLDQIHHFGELEKSKYHQCTVALAERWFPQSKMEVSLLLLVYCSLWVSFQLHESKDLINFAHHFFHYLSF